MSGLASEMRYGLKQIIAAQGGKITFRHVTTLTGANPAPNPPTYIGLIVDGATSAGAATINLKVDLTQGGVFTGRVIAGDTFVITDDATVYTISAQVISPSISDTLTAVPFTPVLAQNAADRAVVTLGFIADHVDIPASITDFSTRLINGTTIQQSDHLIRFLASDIPGIDPIAGDLAILPSGDLAKVISGSHMEIQGVHYGWSLHVRA